MPGVSRATAMWFLQATQPIDGESFVGIGRTAAKVAADIDCGAGAKEPLHPDIGDEAARFVEPVRHFRNQPGAGIDLVLVAADLCG